MWQQTSAEYQAIAYQTFRLAELELKNVLSQGKKNPAKPLAIVADVDETLLDNSAYEVQLIAEAKVYPHRWDEFVNLANSPAIPGAVKFMKSAHQSGVKIFYVTNRRQHLKDATIKNLRLAGFPEVTEETVRCRVTTSSKEPRRSEITKKFNVALYLGDNLGDFSDEYLNKPLDERTKAVEQTKTLFGTRYIILPNPMYGEWEGTIYNHNWALTLPEKEKVRQSVLRGF